MTRPVGYKPGDWLAACFQCGMTRLASTMRRHWQGYYVCPEHWEERHPQDFVMGVEDIQTPPWVQPPLDIYVAFCTLSGISAMPGASIPGCMMPGKEYVEYN